MLTAIASGRADGKGESRENTLTGLSFSPTGFCGGKAENPHLPSSDPRELLLWSSMGN